jgi:hypothetical protein
MKRALYIFLAAGLALGLAGCGESGGGFWPMNPAQGPTSTDQQSTLLGGGALVAAQNLLAPVGNSSLQLNALSSALNTTACPMLPSLPTFTNQAAPAIGGVFANQRFAARTISKGTNTAVSNWTLGAEDGYTKFEYSFNSSVSIPGSSETSGGSDQPACSVLATSQGYGTAKWTFVWYVKYLEANGTAIAVTTGDNAITLAADKVVDQVMYYGSWNLEVCNSDQTYDWKSTGIFGSKNSPWHVKGLAAGTCVEMKGKTTFVDEGKVNGVAFQNLGYSFEIGSDEGFFCFPATGNPTGFYKMGNDQFMVTYTFNGGNTVLISYSPAAPAGAPTSITLNTAD